jgi:hypothetical protein
VTVDEASASANSRIPQDFAGFAKPLAGGLSTLQVHNDTGQCEPLDGWYSILHVFVPKRQNEACRQIRLLKQILEARRTRWIA